MFILGFKGFISMRIQEGKNFGKKTKKDVQKDVLITRVKCASS